MVLASDILQLYVPKSINISIIFFFTDVTNASGISMKQYEEQLNGLRKENFHLKLRVYFLEEKLGNGSPPAVQVSN